MSHLPSTNTPYITQLRVPPSIRYYAKYNPTKNSEENLRSVMKKEKDETDLFTRLSVKYGPEPALDEFTVHYEPGSIGLGLTVVDGVTGVSVLEVRSVVLRC